MMRVPYVDLAAQHAPIKEELLAAVDSILDHGQFILGAEVAEFERRFAALCDTRYAVGVNSGTDALVLALETLGIGSGDEVITVPNSFVASAACIAMVGACPVFVDVREDYNVDPALIESAITPHTRAILPVHLTGRPADVDPIVEIARAHGLYVVEDCAQAVGAEYRGQRVGSFGDVGCFSLHPLKTLNACGDGGVLTTDDEEMYERFKILRNLGEGVTWGHNSRLDTLQAAILLVKLQYLEEWTERRRANARLYQEHLRGVQVPVDEPYEKAVYHTFIVQADRRDQLRAHLAECGIETATYRPIHLQEAASGLGYRAGSFPVTERQAERGLSLPIYPEANVEYVVNCMNGACEC